MGHQHNLRCKARRQEWKDSKMKVELDAKKRQLEGPMDEPEAKRQVVPGDIEERKSQKDLDARRAQEDLRWASGSVPAWRPSAWSRPKPPSGRQEQ